jgi:uncharacterized protein YndB with AHSA1/START domain
VIQVLIVCASPTRVYEALTNAEQFSKVVGGAPTEINPEEGGSFWSPVGTTTIGNRLRNIWPKKKP